MRNALGFLQAKGYDERQQSAIKVARVIDGCEPVEFRALFNRWPEPNEQKGLGRSHSASSIAKTAQARFDASILHSNHQLAAESQMFDDGKGLKEIWFIQNFNLHKMNETKHGEFHSGDCYIVHYQYKLNNVDKHILYYWIVRLRFFQFIFPRLLLFNFNSNLTYNLKIFKIYLFSLRNEINFLYNESKIMIYITFVF